MSELGSSEVSGSPAGNDVGNGPSSEVSTGSSTEFSSFGSTGDAELCGTDTADISSGDFDVDVDERDINERVDDPSAVPEDEDLACDDARTAEISEEYDAVNQEVVDAKNNFDDDHLALSDTADLDETIDEDEQPSWREIQEEHDVSQDAERTNPRFDEGEEWQNNCQRCAPTYEMRRRGYDVEAEPRGQIDDLSYAPERAWDHPDVQTTTGTGKEDIESKMSEWGDGSRSEVIVYWKDGDGHAFSAEQVDGKTVFVDPQNGEVGVERYFDYVRDDGSTRFWRTDDIKPSNRITDCCKES